MANWQTYTTIIGIDPGIGGGITILTEDSVSVHYVPHITEKRGKTNKKNYDKRAMADLLRPHAGPKTVAVLEQVHAMRGQGVTSMFNFGRGFGIWEGIFAGLEFDVELVTPQTWKKQWADELMAKVVKPEILKTKTAEYNRLSPKKRLEYDEAEKEWQQEKKKAKENAKDAARTLAAKLYPDLSDHFKLKKDDGKAESLLIAERKRLEIADG
tara:strand:+ start:438863 stop:439498 length:636 start_codon:yes stop_codon:yes gene_type:complete